MDLRAISVNEVHQLQEKNEPEKLKIERVDQPSKEQVCPYAGTLRRPLLTPLLKDMVYSPHKNNNNNDNNVETDESASVILGINIGDKHFIVLNRRHLFKLLLYKACRRQLLKRC